jgi:hypothetical protein
MESCVDKCVVSPTCVAWLVNTHRALLCRSVMRNMILSMFLGGRRMEVLGLLCGMLGLTDADRSKLGLPPLQPHETGPTSVGDGWFLWASSFTYVGCGSRFPTCLCSTCGRKRKQAASKCRSCKEGHPVLPRVRRRVQSDAESAHRVHCILVRT